MLEEKLAESPQNALGPETSEAGSYLAEGQAAAAERSNAGNFDINQAPGDFVVVRGQAFKMSKTTPSSDVIPTDSSARHSREITAFKEALHSAESRVSKQTEDLKRQSSRIECLEKFIVQHADKLGGTQTLKDLGLDNVSLRASGGSNMGSGGKPRLGFSARRRAESLKSGAYELNVNTAASPSQDDATTNDTPSISAHSELNDTATSLSVINKHGGEEDISPISAANNHSHDLITPVAAGKGDLEEGERASFSGGAAEGVDRTRKSPPVIRRSHSDGQPYSSPTVHVVSDENTELDSNNGSSGSSITRNMTDSAKKGKKEMRRQAEVLEMNSLGAEEAPSPARAPPKGLAARLSMGSQERRRLNEKRRQSSSDNLKALGQQQAGEPASGSGSSTPQKEGNRAPGSSGSDRGYLDMPGSRASSASSNTSTLKHTRASSPPVIAPAFVWGTRDDENAAPHLFVAHDNPQLGQTVASSLRAASTTSGAAGMGFMLESKDEGGMTVFITGTIKYSGPFEAIEGSTLEGDMARGSQCLVGVDMVGYCVNMKTVPTRPRGELIEIDLHPDRKDKSDKGKSSPGLKLAENAVTRKPLSTKAALQSLLKTCKSRVDLILDPYHSDHKWFPYWEGRRKMAPQFRSKGIGYLRLGDDMSNYGSAFLSLDAGATYLDDGESGAVASNASTPQNGTGGGWQSFSRGSSGNSSRPTSNSDSLYSSAGRQLDSSAVTPSSGGSSRGAEDSIPYTEGTHPGPRGNSAGSGDGMPGGIALIHEFGGVIDQPSSPGEDILREEELREILSRLRDPDMKWADRTQSLQRIAEIGVTCAGASEAANSPADSSFAAAATTAGIVASGDKVVMDTIAILRDTLMKQNNPHVLKSALRCLPAISHGVRHRASCAVAWKSLLLESIHMIRTVAKVHEDARIALDYLHSGGEDDRKQPCVSLCQLCGYFEEIILGPRGKGSGKGASNTCKVIQWLQSVGAAELQASITALATLNTRRFRPSVYERVDIGMLFKKSKSTFQHREEATRDAMVHLSSILVTLDILQVTSDSASFLTLTDSLKAGSEEAHEAAIMRAISPSCASGLAEMKKHAKRMFAKAMTATARQLQTSAQVLEAQLSSSSGSSPGSAQTPASEQQPPPQHRSPPLSGSMTSKGASRLRSRGDGSSPGERYFVNSRGSSRGGATQGSGGRATPGSAATRSSASPSTTPRATNSEATRTTGESEVTAVAAAAVPMAVADEELTTSTADAREFQGELSDKWFEVRMMLKVLPTTSSSWNNLVSVSQGCDSFVNDLTGAAHRAGVTRATLLRAVLPFDESTSSNDQAKVTSPSAKAESILSQLGTNEVDSLRDQAVGLRKAVRIKMADEADLQQAITAADMLRDFCGKVDKLSALTSKAPVEIIKTLEAAN